MIGARSLGGSDGNDRPDFFHGLLLWAAAIALGHFIVILVHLWLVVRIQPSFPRSAIPGLILVNLLPVAGALALRMGYRKLAALSIGIPLLIGFLIGTYSHFLSSGTDNVLRMAAGELTLPFQMSAVLLVLLEALGFWVSVRTLTHRT